jgi:endoglycosylceramidase
MLDRHGMGLGVILSLCALATTADAAGALHVDGQYFRDADGGVVILRGVNATGDAKLPPFRPLVDPDAFDPVAMWGMNVVRLPFIWEAYEPAPGVYDESYLDYYAAAAAAATSRGIYVIVDFHQDAFSRFSTGGCGEGFPAWTVPWWVIKSTPNNGAGCGDWGTRMLFDIGTHMSWSAFHGNANGVRTRFLDMIGRVAARVASDEMVIGYDVLNEPWGDEATDIPRLHTDATARLRAVDPKAIIFVSPHALISSGGKSNLRRPTFDNFAFSPHFYDGFVLLFKSWTGGLPDGAFANMRGVADAWGVPLLVGEFGAPAGTARGADYVHAAYDGLDAALASGAQWVYTPGWTPERKDGWNHEDLSIVDDTGATRDNFVARPYPRRVAGTPTRFALVRGAAQVVELEWRNSPDAGETEIVVPAQALFGTQAMTVETSDSDVVCSTGPDVVVCGAGRAGLKAVRIRAGS